MEFFRAEAMGDPLAYALDYNIAPTTTQPVLRQKRDTLQRELVPMRWGLVAFESRYEGQLADMIAGAIASKTVSIQGTSLLPSPRPRYDFYARNIALS